MFSCFSLLFKSPLVRLSFSSSVTFFSRKLTYNRGQRWGWIKPLRPENLETTGLMARPSD